jgi:uncharacterized surface protein with fasciclin (FAS1) repeats
MRKAMVAVAVVGMAFAGQAQAQTAPSNTIVDVAVGAGSFTTLVAAVKAAGLEDVLRGTGPFTVFAPTDAAFAKLPAGTVESLLANPAQLRAVLTYHVVPGKVMAADVIAAGTAAPATVQGQTLNVRVVDGKVMVNDATVVSADVGASNGVIHVIDTVVLPRMD